MHRSTTSSSDGTPRYRGSAVLASGLQRMVRVLPPVALMWVLTGWAMGWW